MNWNTLLNPNRFGATENTSNTYDNTRNDFQRDYDRLIFSSPFRRLQNKTQVFPLPGSIFVHNRLTHSLEVSSVGRSLGKNTYRKIRETQPNVNENLLQEIPTIVSAACLAHDMGNPPFGHSGEDAIRNFFSENEASLKSLFDDWEWNDLIRFEGNANALRLLTQQLNGRRKGGYRLSHAVLASIVKYPYSSIAGLKKLGFFKSEASSFKHIAETTGLVELNEMVYCRHPLVYLVEAADDISYQIMDIEDAHKLGILSTNDTIDYLRAFFADETAEHRNRIDSTLKEVSDINEQVAYLRSIAISKLVEDCSSLFIRNIDNILDGQPVKPLIDQLSGAPKNAMDIIAEIAKKQVYQHRHVVEIEIAGFRILYDLLQIFTEAILNPKKSLSKKVISLIPYQFIIESEEPYAKIQSILDFISGMTDVYALDTYRLIKGIELPSL
ncbi:MAG TPA: dNTP triphosphohydrolase [Tenuifilaceae bacterium]|nr:dNTP triphosphohydrolase [Tenuifilaceae bacterium]